MRRGQSAADLIKTGPPADDEVVAEHWPLSERTIQELVKRVRPAEVPENERWTLTPDEPDPEPILAALYVLVEESRGRLWYLSKDQAAWIRVIHKARPTWTAAQVLYVAQSYINAHALGVDPVGLDHAMAYINGDETFAWNFMDFVDGGAAGVRSDLIRYAAKIQRDVYHGPKDQQWQDELERVLGRKEPEML